MKISDEIVMKYFDVKPEDIAYDVQTKTTTVYLPPLTLRKTASEKMSILLKVNATYANIVLEFHSGRMTPSTTLLGSYETKTFKTSGLPVSADEIMKGLKQELSRVLDHFWKLLQVPKRMSIFGTLLHEGVITQEEYFGTLDAPEAEDAPKQNLDELF